MSTADVLESSGLRAGAYAVTGLICVVAARRESARQLAVRWPAFWYLTAAVLVAMAIARAIGIDDFLTELGRERARLDGWYRVRRGLQAGLVSTVAVTWVVVVFFSIWRVPERRRRYLPTALASFTIMCFAAARLVSLHHVDTLLYRRSIAGVAVVAIAEWGSARAHGHRDHRESELRLAFGRTNRIAAEPAQVLLDRRPRVNGWRTDPAGTAAVGARDGCADRSLEPAVTSCRGSGLPSHDRADRCDRHHVDQFDRDDVHVDIDIDIDDDGYNDFSRGIVLDNGVDKHGRVGADLYGLLDV